MVECIDHFTYITKFTIPYGLMSYSISAPLWKAVLAFINLFHLWCGLNVRLLLSILYDISFCFDLWQWYVAFKRGDHSQVTGIWLQMHLKRTLGPPNVSCWGWMKGAKWTWGTDQWSSGSSLADMVKTYVSYLLCSTMSVGVGTCWKKTKGGWVEICHQSIKSLTVELNHFDKRQVEIALGTDIFDVWKQNWLCHLSEAPF